MAPHFRCARAYLTGERQNIMSAEAKKGYGSTMLLLILGVLALYGGARWLLVLIPTAVVVWYAAAGAAFRRRRNLPGMDDNSGDVRRNPNPAATANRAQRPLTL
jgi:hypothetical protein